MIILKPSIIIDKAWAQSLRILRRERWQRKAESWYVVQKTREMLLQDDPDRLKITRRKLIQGLGAGAALVAGGPRPASALMRGGLKSGGGGFSACGQTFPNASTTGFRGTLSPQTTGDMVTTSNGQVIQNINLNGGIIVHHDNVSILNCNIVNGTGAAAFGIDNNNETGQHVGMIVDHCTFTHGDYGIQGPGTVTNCDMSIVENGWLPVDNSIGSGNYIHDLLNPVADPHYDCIEINAGNNIELFNNTLINPFAQTSCIYNSNFFGPVTNVNMHNNYMQGAGYCLYWAGTFNNDAMNGGKFDNNVLGGWASGPWDLDNHNGNPNYVLPENHGNIQFDSTPTACASISF